MLLYNTQSQQKELFKPLRAKEVSMYVCGITPYDTTHLGHAFTFTAFDMLYRYLTFSGYTVKYAQNVTDIDDDLLRKARETCTDWKTLGEEWTRKYLDDMQTLHNVFPTYYVKATDTIETIILIVQELLRKNLAYERDGTVFFRVQADPEYGKLSHYSPRQMTALSRIRGANPDDPRKEYPLDFILWQQSLPNEPSWKSPWGQGRPGWHIECSAMVYKYLYKNIDIHGGGSDLIYPHHESERAQSEHFTDTKPFVRYWMHTGAVMYEAEKMSKSLGNLIMVSDLLKKYSPNAIRYLLLSHHYREPWEYCEKDVETAEKELERLQKQLKSAKKDTKNKAVTQAFMDALADDLNTPEAITILTQGAASVDTKTLSDMLSLLGLEHK